MTPETTFKSNNDVGIRNGLGKNRQSIHGMMKHNRPHDNTPVNRLAGVINFNNIRLSPIIEFVETNDQSSIAAAPIPNHPTVKDFSRAL